MAGWDAGAMSRVDRAEELNDSCPDHEPHVRGSTSVSIFSLSSVTTWKGRSPFPRLGQDDAGAGGWGRG